jgi:hypothetical protein
MNARTATAQRVTPPNPAGLHEQSQHPMPALVAPKPPIEVIPPEPKAYPPSMAKAILKIMREIGAIQKSGWNDFHMYHYQKWEDILDRLSVLLADNGLIIIPSEVSRSLVENDQQKNDQLVAITYDFTIVNEEGECWPERPRITAFGRVRDSKNICDDKAAAKCHTQAEKYFLIHFFKIRTGDVPDSDADGNGTKEQPKQIAQASGKPKPPRPEGAAPRKPAILSTEKTTFRKWSTEYIECIKQAASIADVGQWGHLNVGALDVIKAEKPDLHAEIEKITQDRLNDLAAREDAKPLKPPAPDAQKAPAPTKNDMPDPGDSVPKWLAWLDGKLAAFKEGEGEQMETYWNDKIAPIVDQLLPIDVEEALGLYRKHEQRIAP